MLAETAASVPGRSPSWSPSFEVGQLETERPLGRGAFGEVFLVRVHASALAPWPEEVVPKSAQFALKRTSLAGLSEAGLQRAKSEAVLLQRLGQQHPCILQCFDARLLHGSTAALELLLEFAPLGDLGTRIRQRAAQADARGMPEGEVLTISSNIADGLAFLHSQHPKVLHRDVKPANVVLFPSAQATSGHGLHAKLADFGIAKVIEADRSLDGAVTVIGTPHYFSPEMCRGESYDERSDAWALGCIMYEMMCLHRPFHEAEGNLAALALRAMEGRYDKAALERRASLYNGLLIFTLFRLLAVQPAERSRASEALQSLQQLQHEARVRGGEDAAGLDRAIPWWELEEQLDETRAAERAMEEILWQASCGDRQQAASTTDSWASAKAVKASQAPTETQRRRSEAAAGIITLIPGSDVDGDELSSSGSHDDCSLLLDGTLHPRDVIELSRVPVDEDIPEAEQNPSSMLACMDGGAMGLLMSDPPATRLEQRQDGLCDEDEEERSLQHSLGDGIDILTEGPVTDMASTSSARSRVLLRPLQAPGAGHGVEEAPVIFRFHRGEASSEPQVVLECSMTMATRLALARNLSTGWLQVDISPQLASSLYAMASNNAPSAGYGLQGNPTVLQ